MSIFDQLGKTSTNSLPDKNELARLVQQLQSNPTGFIQKMGFNIPNNLNNPNDILGFLMQSNQVNGGLLSKAQQLLKLFM